MTQYSVCCPESSAIDWLVVIGSYRGLALLPPAEIGFAVITLPAEALRASWAGQQHAMVFFLELRPVAVININAEIQAGKLAEDDRKHEHQQQVAGFLADKMLGFG